MMRERRCEWCGQIVGRRAALLMIEGRLAGPECWEHWIDDPIWEPGASDA
jgi:hypothetical protein